MTEQLHRTLTAIQHLVTTARSKAYFNDDHQRVAELLDLADHLFNLVKEKEPDFARIARVLQEASDRFSECSRTLLVGES